MTSSEHGGRRYLPYAFSEQGVAMFSINGKNVYHFGASLKDLGKKWFAFSRMEKETFSLIENLEKVAADE